MPDTLTFIDRWNLHSPYFSLEEIFSPSTLGHPHLVDYDSLDLLNSFRRDLGVVLLCNHGPHKRRGVRSPEDQRDLQRQLNTAADLSMHVQGKAFDLSSPSLSVQDLAAAAIRFGWSAVGIYKSFVHVDNRYLWEQKQIVFRKD